MPVSMRMGVTDSPGNMTWNANSAKRASTQPHRSTTIWFWPFLAKTCSECRNPISEWDGYETANDPSSLLDVCPGRPATHDRQGAVAAGRRHHDGRRGRRRADAERGCAPTDRCLARPGYGSAENTFGLSYARTFRPRQCRRLGTLHPGHQGCGSPRT